MMDRPLMYDVGMHNGDDSEYYLAKGYRVIGIEANTALCKRCEERFHTEIASGLMTILNVGVGERSEVTTFNINLREDAVSTFRPVDAGADGWQHVDIEVRTLSSIIMRHGFPKGIKIDVEHYDHVVLLDLFKAGLRPRYISAEVHTIDVYCALVCMGYDIFKIVEGVKIPTLYSNLPVRSLSGESFTFGFSKLSSGPFCEDVPESWQDKNEVLRNLLSIGLGWVDLHASFSEGNECA
jgi:FkbM family methyltransferase